MVLFTPSDQTVVTPDSDLFQQDSFLSDVVGLDHLSLSFSYSKSGSQLKEDFLIPYWLKWGQDCQEGVWFCLSDLYNDLAKWLSQNNPTIARRNFWIISHNWLSSYDVRALIIDSIRQSPYSEDVDKLSRKNNPHLSYAKIAQACPYLFMTTGKLKSTKCYAHEHIITSFFFVWLTSRSGYPLHKWIQDELYAIDRTAIE